MTDRPRAPSTTQEQLFEIERSINENPAKAYRRLQALRRQIGETDRRLASYCELLMGRCRQRQGRSGEAYALVSRCVRALEEIGAKRETALGYHYLAQINAARNDIQSSLECCLRGMQIAKRARDWYLQMHLNIDMCPIYRAVGDFDASIACYLRGRDILFKHLKGKDPSIKGAEEYTEFIIDLNLAILYLNVGECGKCVEALDNIAGSVESVLKGAYIDQFHIEYAHACFGLGRIDEGAAHADIVIGRLEKGGSDALHGVPMNCLNLCLSLIRHDEYDRAIRLVSLIRAPVERENDPRVAGMLQRVLASCYEKQGDYQAAAASYARYCEYVDQCDAKRSEENKVSMGRRMTLQKAVDRQQKRDEARSREMLRLKQEMEFKTEREEILVNISENTDTFFLLYSPERKAVDFVSRNGRRLFGFDAAEGDLCGNLFSWLQINGGDAEEFMTGKLKTRVSRDCQTKNPLTGAPVTVHLEMIPSANRHLILVLNDVTAIMNTNASLVTAIQAAQQASAAKTVFLSNMSHDIRTPLNAILGLFDMMEDSLSDAALTKRYLQMARQSSRHLLALINDVLDMSRIEAGRVSLSAERFRMSAFLESVMSIIRPQAEARGQTLRLLAGGVGHEVLYGDPLRLRQVFINILGNAVKFTKNGGAITLAARRRPPMREGFEGYVFDFIDNGRGMSPEFARRIFNPFERGDETVRSIEGTGLGMAITKSIVDMMSGELTVQSELGKGSTFTLTLDFERAEGESAPSRAQSGALRPHIGRAHGTVLLAEDNAMNALIAQYQLKKIGYTVETVENGKRALELFEASEVGHYSVILMDIRMPIMDGYETTRRIRASRRDDAATVPVVAMTADAFAEDVRAAREAGMNAHLAKPLDIARLAETLHAVTNGADAAQ